MFPLIKIFNVTQIWLIICPSAIKIKCAFFYKAYSTIRTPYLIKRLLSFWTSCGFLIFQYDWIKGKNGYFNTKFLNVRISPFTILFTLVFRKRFLKHKNVYFQATLKLLYCFHIYFQATFIKFYSFYELFEQTILKTLIPAKIL